MKEPFTIKRGSAAVHGYPLRSGRWTVVWRESEHGPRRRATRATERAARILAGEKATAIANSMADVLELTGADRDAYREARAILDPLGVPLHAAVTQFAAAHKAIHPHTLHEATTFFLRGHAERRATPPTTEILSGLLDELADDRRSSKYVEPLRRDLEPFAKAHPDLGAVSEDQIRAYLRDLRTTRASRDRATGQRQPKGSPVSPRRRDNVRDAIVRLFYYAKKREHLAHDRTTVAERIPRISEAGPVTTFDPGTVTRILHHLAVADPAWLPWAAIAAFAGLRTSEIFRLDWSAFKWDTPTIAVTRAVARKVRIDRQVPFLPVLAAWLAPWRHARGPVMDGIKHLEYAHERTLRRLEKALDGAVWKPNALRHSFGSHRLAIVKSYDQVALEMGNSPSQVRAHYNDPKPEPEAVAYFAQLPTPEAGKIIRLRG